MKKERLIQIIEKFNGTKILVIGDIILDSFIEGETNRTSPEAPVPVVEVKDERFVLGGAANTASNIKEAGGDISLVGVVGNDKIGDNLVNLLSQKNIDTGSIVKSSGRSTTLKTRVISKEKHILRIDWEDTHGLSEKTEEEVLTILENMKGKVDGVIVSDYLKGVITKKVAETLLDIYKDVPIIVDTKRTHMEWFKGVTLFTPNLKEAREMTHSSYKENEIEEMGKDLREKLESFILVTQGEKGMTLFDSDGSYHIPSCRVEAKDVTGAGDTVSAFVALSLAAGFSMRESVSLANYAAAVAVTKVGTAAVSKDEVIELYESKSNTRE